MLIETFGPYFHQGIVTNAHRLCGGCGWNRAGHLRALRGPEPVMMLIPLIHLLINSFHGFVIVLQVYKESQ